MTKYKIIDSQLKIETHPLEPNFAEYVFAKAEYNGTTFYIRSKRVKGSETVTSKAYALELESKSWHTSWMQLLNF